MKFRDIIALYISAIIKKKNFRILFANEAEAKEYMELLRKVKHWTFG